VTSHNQSVSTATGNNHQGNPGPGEYDVTKIGIRADSKYVTKRVRGKSMKMRKPELTTGTFKSTTGRLVEDDLKLEVKT